MKKHLTHIENNLRAIFENNNLFVLSAYDCYGKELTEERKENSIYQYVICLTKDNADKWLGLVTPSKLFLHRFDTTIDYEHERSIYNTSRRLVVNFNGLDFIEQKQNKEHKDEVEKVLIACEFKTKREPKLLPLQFIKKHTATYGVIYKMLSDLSKKQMLSCELKNKWIEDRRNKDGGYYVKALYFYSDNGKYNFPVSHMSDTCTDEEIITLFTNLVAPELFKNLLLTQNIAA